MLSAQLLQAFAIDFCGTIMSSLGTFGYQRLDFWRIASILIALWMMVAFSAEFYRQYTLTEALHSKKKTEITKFENDLRKMYVDGMDKEGVM